MAAVGRVVNLGGASVAAGMVFTLVLRPPPTLCSLLEPTMAITGHATNMHMIVSSWIYVSPIPVIKMFIAN